MAGLTEDASPEARWPTESLELAGASLSDFPRHTLGATRSYDFSFPPACSGVWRTLAMAEANGEVGVNFKEVN